MKHYSGGLFADAKSHLARLGHPSWAEGWEPYRPRRIPWAAFAQMIAVAMFFSAAYVSVQPELPALPPSTVLGQL